jgi:hypothetical protein
MSHFAYYNTLPSGKGIRGKCVALARRALRRLLRPHFTARERRLQNLSDLAKEVRKTHSALDACISALLALDRHALFVERALDASLQSANISTGEPSSPPHYGARCA